MGPSSLSGTQGSGLLNRVGYSLIGLLNLVIGVLALLDLGNQRPRLPVALDASTLTVEAGSEPSDAQNSLAPGDRLIAVEGSEIKSSVQLEFLLDRFRPGQKVNLTVERQGFWVTASATLVPSLEPPLLAVTSIVALLLWSFSMFALLRSTPNIQTLSFFGAAQALCHAILLHWPLNPLVFPGGEVLSAFGFYLGVTLGAAFLIHFMLVFPEAPFRSRFDWILPLVYLPSFLLGTVAGWLLLQAQASQNGDFATVSAFVHSKLIPIHTLVYFFLGLGVLGASYKRVVKPSSRARIKWVLFGLIAGISPQIFLYELPHNLLGVDLLPKAATLALLAATPIACVIAIAKLRLVDTNLVLRRLLSYSLLTLAVTVAYLGFVALGDLLAHGILGKDSTAIRVVVVLLLSAVFEPARRLSVRLTDQIFARSRTDQQANLIAFSRRLARTLHLEEVADAVKELIERTLSVDRVSLFVAEDHDLRDIRSGARVPNQELPGLLGGCDSSAIIPDHAYDNDSISGPIETADFLLPLRTEDRLVGLLALGPKHSGEEYGPGDQQFLKAVAAQLAVSLDRARAFALLHKLNQELEQKIFERTAQLAEANDRMAEQYTRLSQLNEMKELLSRMVVHDLKNPVSTILLGLEFLDRNEPAKLPEDVRNTLGIISSTARVIQDLIANLLDVYRMEAGELHLELARTDLGALFGEATQRIEVSAQMRNIRIDSRVPIEEITCDHNLILRVLVNVLSNAVKHAKRGTVVELEASLKESAVEIAIINSGPVIPKEFHEKIFDKFFQIEGKRTGVASGTGLGLTFCRMAVEAHRGRIWVESPVAGRENGACFRISLPRAEG